MSVDAASQHWVALDRVFRRLVSGRSTVHERTRLAQRAAALSHIYVRRLIRLHTHETRNRSDLRRQLLQLQQTHRALAAALAASPDEAPPTSDQMR